LVVWDWFVVLIPIAAMKQKSLAQIKPEKYHWYEVSVSASPRINAGDRC
jgi:hypothetical protein